jgi:hypothetical protein
MRRLIGTVAVLGLCVVVFGFYRSWFTLSRPASDNNDNKINVQLSVDSDKVKSDVAEAKDKAAELAGQETEAPD